MKKIKKIGIALFGVFIAVMLLNVALTKSYASNNPWRAQERVLVMAHGGAKKLNPENTMKAFKEAYEMGVDVLEMDVMMTKDGILVTHHGTGKDGNISLMSDGEGTIHEKTYEELQAYNFGYKFVDLEGNRPYESLTIEEVHAMEINIPKLETLFETFGTNILYNIEVKAPEGAEKEGAVDALFAMIRQYDLEDYVLVATFDNQINAYYYESAPHIPQSTSVGPTTKFVLANLVGLPFVFEPKNQAALQLPLIEEAPVIGELALAKAKYINAAHKQNLAVHYWTINDPEEMQMLIDLGADGIITDRPDLLLELLK